ncbi:MAG: hypothetical protein ACLKAK_07315 [Alkaliphilus sp.]
MTVLKVTPINEIKIQAEPEVITIPGFRSGATINVAVRMIDLTPKLLTLGIGNPLLAKAQDLAKEGLSQEEIAEKLGSGEQSDVTSMISLLDEIAKEALASPTYEEIMAIHPLTLPQKLKILSYIMSEETLDPFRDKQGVRTTD